MCIICIEFQKGSINAQEARRARSELVNTGEIDKEHAQELEALLDEKEDEGNGP